MALGDRDTIAAAPLTVAWRSAAADLGIRFESPFRFEYRATVYWCSGWLPDFGGPTGTIIAGRDTVDDFLDAADGAGYYTSGLNPLHYETYDRKLFVETLNDWVWYGDPSQSPPWFSGGINRHGGAAEPGVEPGEG